MSWPASEVTRCVRAKGAGTGRGRAAAWPALRRWALAGACFLGCVAAAPLVHAQTAGSGPIVIPGPGETNPAAALAMAQSAGMQTAAPAAMPAMPAAVPVTRSASHEDEFAHAAAASGAIVIPGPGEHPAQTAAANAYTGNNPGNYAGNANAAANPRQVIPVVVASAPQVSRQNAQAVAMNTPAGASIDPLSARGEPPELASGASPRYVRNVRGTNAVNAAPASLPQAAQTAQVAQVASAAVTRVAVQPVRAVQAASVPVTAAGAANPAAPAGQEDGESIRQAALAFLQQQAQGLPGNVSITVNQVFPRGLAACASLTPFMPTGSRMWGRTTIGVRCVGDRPWTLYVQARVSVQATYYVSARALAPGDVLSAADLVARDGDLTTLPMAVIIDPSQAVGSVALMRVSEGMPLRRDMIRSASAVTVGQTVRIVANGQGFSISSEGSAMNNASPGQTVRVKTAAGQIIQGVVKDGGTVEIQL
ncbi:flagellar basal body P-ring formation protein FlgA [Trinickia violacea]|uniref:Flagellar basal body P-ring formation protein FlgA n=1 Tax=Trinickia violacea TaxID=2571746 RepID=A0A4P8IPF4_9BURK|nr:flagellar basal body P-ring formation chaperone FlgA [Trinickia violacea]QCP47789.1 flagellar basal body P-ring formation protein FlgA [Trinickia violacea]